MHSMLIDTTSYDFTMIADGRSITIANHVQLHLLEQGNPYFIRKSDNYYMFDFTITDFNDNDLRVVLSKAYRQGTPIHLTNYLDEGLDITFYLQEDVSVEIKKQGTENYSHLINLKGAGLFDLAVKYWDSKWVAIGTKLNTEYTITKNGTPTVFIQGDDLYYVSGDSTDTVGIS